MTAPASPSPYRKPDRPPSEADLEDRRLWDQLSDSSLDSTRAAADKWRAGLAAFITIVTGSLFLKGPEEAAQLTTGWRVFLTLVVGVALFTSVLGLWFALRAAAGSPARLNFTDVVTRYGGVRQFQLVCADRASEELRKAKLLVIASIVLFAGGALAWWWAPTSATSSTLVRVLYSGHTVCGTLVELTAADLEVSVSSGVDPIRVEVSQLSSPNPVTTCSP